MDNSYIEEVGINNLENFFLKTKIICPVLNKMDKYPIWDGELIVYNSNNRNKKNIKFRIPTQVKTELFKGEYKAIENYSINISDLEKYATEGGVLFIKVLYNDKEDKCYFYMKNIMKGEINDIIRNTKEKQMTKSIALDEVNISDLLPLCMNFNLHRELQMQLPNISKQQGIDYSGDIHTFSYINEIEDILRKEQYAYMKTDFDLYAYVGKVSFDSIYNTARIGISTETKKYYDKVTCLYQKEKRSVKISDYVEIIDEKICINNNVNLETLLSDAVYDLEFVLDLYKNKKLRIGNSEYIHLEFQGSKTQDKINKVENNLNYLKAAARVLERLHIPLDAVTVKSVISDEIDVCKMDQIINNGKLIKFQNVNTKIFLNSVNILGYTFLVYFIKQENGSYKGYDYLHDDYVYNCMVVKDNGDVQLSRYFNISCDILSNMIVDKGSIINEIKKCTKNEITNTYINNLMLEFIKAYDIKPEKIYLSIASEINKILRKQRNFYTEDFFKINKYQILKRLKKLSEEDQKKILRMKLTDSDVLIKCSCCILLEDYDEFDIYFETVDDDKRKLYCSWAIFELLDKKRKNKILKQINT